MTDAKEVEECSKDKPESMYDAEVGGCRFGKEMELDEEKRKEGREEDEEEDEEDEETEESEENDELDKDVLPGSEDVSDDDGRELDAEASIADDNRLSQPDVNKKSKVVNVGDVVTRTCINNHADGIVSESSLTRNMEIDEKHRIKDEKEALSPDIEDGVDRKTGAHEAANCHVDEIIPRSQAGVGAPNVGSSANVEYMRGDEPENKANTKEAAMDTENQNPSHSCIFDTDTSGGGESGTEDEQAAFMNELEKFHKEKFLEFKPPKFYGEPLNLLKLWRAVMRLGGYDKVTTCKFWRQVGESFKPPKTCTTVSWTFRIFYEKALLEYERYRTSSDGPSVPASLPVPTSVENQASGSGRARRDAAARAMQGWHSQRILDNGEVSDPIIKDKNSASLSKREKQLKNLGMLKRKKPSSMDAAVKDVRPKVPKPQSETTVIDIGSPADWVKINVQVTKDCYEVYALVPGLLREEVRVQSDPAGRLVISGEPENPDNPWCVTPFKKVVNLPLRIDPHQTSAVVTLHGQLFVRVPFEQYD